MFEFLEDYRVRMENMAPFACLHEKLSNAKRYEQYNIFTLTFSTMLFMLDGMIKNIGSDSMAIADFLHELIYENYKEKLTSDESMEICHYILFDILQNSGFTYKYKYMNPFTSLTEYINVSLIAQDEVKIGRQKVKYKLTDQGMEMLFMTKEVHKELRIPVTQFYLKQQIEKGVFDKALHIVDDLSIMVKQLREKVNDIVRKIKVNALSIKFSEYEDIHEKIFEQFKRDEEEFKNLVFLLEEKKNIIESVSSGKRTEEEKKALILLYEISERLAFIVNEHKRLFIDKLDLQRIYQEAIKNQISAGFMIRLNFETEILDSLVNNNSSVDVNRKIIAPLLRLKRNKYFHIAKSTQEQMIREESEDIIEKIEEDVQENQEENKKEQIKKRYEHYKKYLSLFISNINSGSETSLEEVLKNLQRSDREDIISTFDFYSFLIMFHQAGEINLNEVYRDSEDIIIEDYDEVHIEHLLTDVSDKNPLLKEFRSILFYSNDEIITLENHIRLSNFKMKFIR